MQTYVVVFGTLALIAALLCSERALVRRWHRRIPLRIAVLGTRGKSSVVRLIAFGLRADSRLVAYKTTGSRPVLGNVDGTESVLRRRSRATPLEQRRVLREAVRQRADVAVVEAMSVRPESLRAEIHRLVAPAIVVITNVGRDHLADIDDPCAAFADAVPRGALTVVPADAPRRVLDRLDALGAKVHAVEPSDSGVPSLRYEEWCENLDLALAACAVAGTPAPVARRGMNDVIPDHGALSAWRVPHESRTWITVNGFAANDPDATRRALDRALARWHDAGAPVVGVLNLRRDRGDRTLQWLETLLRQPWPFDRLVVTGHVPWSVRRSLRQFHGERVGFVDGRHPTTVMAVATSGQARGGFVFGFGNMAGIGTDLVEDWRKRGVAL